MIAYLIGGPNDLTKLEVEEEVECLSMPSREVSHYFPSGWLRSTPAVKSNRYKRFRHQLMDQFYLFHYEGTW